MKLAIPIVPLLIGIQAEIIQGRVETMTIIERFDVEEKLGLGLAARVIELVIDELAFQFAEWSDGLGTTEEVTTTITGDTVITASFTQDAYTLDVLVDPAEGSSVAVDPDQSLYVKLDR